MRKRKYVPPQGDTFESKARSVLHGPENQPILEALLTLRREAQISLQKLSSRTLSGGPTADVINTNNQKFFDATAKLLGPEQYERIFGEPPGTVELVDPHIHRASMSSRR